MQMWPWCDKVYDESEYSRCPYCHPNDYREQINIVYDDNIGKALELTDEEYEEFKKIHAGYC